jgi:hypothetical protein
MKFEIQYSKIDLIQNKQIFGGKNIGSRNRNLSEKGNRLLFVVHVSRAGTLNYLDCQYATF